MKTLGILLGLLVAAPALAHHARTDKCGCHNQYGLRHCHPSKKTKRCEAPVSTVPPSPAPPAAVRL